VEKLSYKTFFWPQNPHTYREEYQRKAEYSVIEGISYFDGMGDMKRIITGEGVFFGDTAFSEFRKLAILFEDGKAGNLEHPVWGIRYCYFTGLELTQEPKENCVSYRFEFTCADINGEVPK